MLMIEEFCVRFAYDDGMFLHVMVARLFQSSKMQIVDRARLSVPVVHFEDKKEYRSLNVHIKYMSRSMCTSSMGTIVYPRKSNVCHRKGFGWWA